MSLLERPDPTWLEVEEFVDSWQLKDDTFMVVRVFDKTAGTLTERSFVKVREAVHYVEGFDTDDYEVTWYNPKELWTSTTFDD
jgi:hypothetical protein